MRNLFGIMQSKETAEALSRVISICVNNWIQKLVKDIADNPPKLPYVGYKEWKRIGWDGSLKGRMTIKWGRYAQ
jgi:hypothetical protein